MRVFDGMTQGLGKPRRTITRTLSAPILLLPDPFLIGQKGARRSEPRPSPWAGPSQLILQTTLFVDVCSGMVTTFRTFSPG